MSAFKDSTAEIEEKATERMHFRAKPHIKRAIQRAAALSGVDDSVFTMTAAYDAALDTIARHERMVLQPEDCEVFFAALDNPPKPIAKLRAAFERHDRLVKSRGACRISRSSSSRSIRRGMTAPGFSAASNRSTTSSSEPPTSWPRPAISGCS
jgi:uncharacterized protein (DUF1778 family)